MKPKKLLEEYRLHEVNDILNANNKKIVNKSMRIKANRFIRKRIKEMTFERLSDLFSVKQGTPLTKEYFHNSINIIVSEIEGIEKIFNIPLSITKKYYNDLR